MRVLGTNAAWIVNGASSSISEGTDYGKVAWTSTSSQPFTITNMGPDTLTLDGVPPVMLTGNTNAFTVIQPPSTNLNGGGTTSFVVAYAPTNAGIHSAMVSIANTVVSNSPYTFSLQGILGEPNIENLAATGISGTHATVNGDLSSTGMAPTTVWMFWGTSDAGSVWAGWQYTNAFGARDAGMLSTNITDLNPATTYHYTFFASNDCGEVWSSPSTGFGTLAPPGLVAYWKFDEASGSIFADSAGGPGANAPYHGTVANGASLGVEGRFGKAFRHFSADGGSTGIVPSDMISDNNLDGSNARTFSMWFNHAHTYTGTDPGIQLISYGNAGGFSGGKMLMLCLQGSDGQRRITPMIHQRGRWGDSSTVGHTNVWNHIALAYGGETNFSTIQVFVNGVNLGPPVSVEADPVLETVIDVFGIGGPADGGWNNDGGRIDDLGVWNVALGSAKAKALYNLAENENLNYSIAEVRQLFDRFDAGAGTVVIDGLSWHYTETLATAEPGEVVEEISTFTVRLGDIGFGLTTRSSLLLILR